MNPIQQFLIEMLRNMEVSPASAMFSGMPRSVQPQNPLVDYVAEMQRLMQMRGTPGFGRPAVRSAPPTTFAPAGFMPSRGFSGQMQPLMGAGQNFAQPNNIPTGQPALGPPAQRAPSFTYVPGGAVSPQPVGAYNADYYRSGGQTNSYANELRSLLTPTASNSVRVRTR